MKLGRPRLPTPLAQNDFGGAARTANALRRKVMSVVINMVIKMSGQGTKAKSSQPRDGSSMTLKILGRHDMCLGLIGTSKKCWYAPEERFRATVVAETKLICMN